MKKIVIQNKKPLIAVAIIFVLVVGITFAFFKTTDFFDNLFNTGTYAHETLETFTSPTNWAPGDTTTKEVSVANRGDICQNVRISLDEEWEDALGNELPLEQNGNKAAIINLANTSDWQKVGNYYYYKYNLLADEETSLFMDSVTFNDNISNSISCTSTGTNERTCASTERGYDGGQYTLTLHIDTEQCVGDNGTGKDGIDPHTPQGANVWGIDFDELYAMFDTGQVVNVKMRVLAGSNPSIDAQDQVINSFRRSYNRPSSSNMAQRNIVSSSDSTFPIYAWKQGVAIYWYSEADEVYLNPDSSNMFKNMKVLGDIGYFEDWVNLIDRSQIEALRQQVATGTIGADEINSMTKYVTNMESMFEGCSTFIVNFSGDTFYAWDVHNVINMKLMFNDFGKNAGIPYTISDLTLDGLKHWNVSRVQNFHGMFAGATVIDTSFVQNWNMSSALDIGSMFRYTNSTNTRSFSLAPFENWDVSKVITMNKIFEHIDNLDINTLNAISGWDVSSVDAMQGGFNYIFSLFNSYYSYMFEFSSRRGEWSVVNYSDSVGNHQSLSYQPNQ